MRAAHAGAIVFLLSVALAYYARIADQWFLWDDPQLLSGVISHPLSGFFFDPEVWRTQSSTNFVPLLLADFKLDWLLFGLDVRWYYIHHLVVLIAAFVAFYAYLTMISSRPAAVAGTLALIMSAPSFCVGSLLSDRHYAEGLLFSLAVLMLEERGKSKTTRALALLCYFIACLEKEVFVPLPALLVMRDVVRRRSLREIAFVIVRYSAVLAIYMPWRLWMLGKFGGYGAARSLSEIAALPADAFRAAVGQSAAAAVPLAIALAVLVVASLQRLRPFALVAAGCAIFIAPPLLALRVMDERYVFAATVTLIAAWAAALRNDRRLIVQATFVVLCLTLAISGYGYREEQSRSLELMKKEGLYLWTEPRSARPLLTASNGWYTEGVRWLRQITRGDQGPPAIGSVRGLVLESLQPDAVASFELTPEQLERAHERASAGRTEELPLEVHMRREGNVLSWRLSGSRERVYYFLPEPHKQLIPLGEESWIRLPSMLRAPTFDLDPAAATFRVTAESNGRWRSTPPLPFPRPGEAVHWPRK